MAIKASLIGIHMCVAVTVSAENALMDGGRSPQGRYEVRVVQTNADPSNYDIRLYTAVSHKSFLTLEETGGYLRYATALERDHAIWHPSGKFVVITDQGTRHSREICVVAASSNHTEMLKLPDYVQNALGRVKAVSIDQTCVNTPKRWEGDDLIVQLDFSANGRHRYTCEVILHMTWEENSAPYIGLKSVSDPTESEG